MISLKVARVGADWLEERHLGFSEEQRAALGGGRGVEGEGLLEQTKKSKVCGSDLGHSLVLEETKF